MNLTKNKFHSKLYKFFYKTDNLPNDLCSYFWGLLIALILAIPITIIKIPVLIATKLKYFKEDENTWWEEFFMSLFCWSEIVACFMVGLHLVTNTFSTLIVMGILSLILILICSLVKFGEYTETEEFRIVKERIKAKKDNGS